MFGVCFYLVWVLAAGVAGASLLGFGFVGFLPRFVVLLLRFW